MENYLYFFFSTLISQTLDMSLFFPFVSSFFHRNVQNLQDFFNSDAHDN